MNKNKLLIIASVIMLSGLIPMSYAQLPSITAYHGHHGHHRHHPHHPYHHDVERGQPVSIPSKATYTPGLPDLSKVPTFKLHGEFNDRMTNKFNRFVRQLNMNKPSPIAIDIRSPGGYMYSLKDMVSTVKRLQSRGFTVITIVRSRAASAGANLFLYGNLRVITGRTILEFHSVQGGRGCILRHPYNGVIARKITQLTGDSRFGRKMMGCDLTAVRAREMMKRGLATTKL